MAVIGTTNLLVSRFFKV